MVKVCMSVVFPSAGAENNYVLCERHLPMLCSVAACDENNLQEVFWEAKETLKGHWEAKGQDALCEPWGDDINAVTDCVTD